MNIKELAKKLKSEVLTLYFCCKNPKTPLIAKVLAILVIGYALSPIDLIPDFIPVIGLLDDLILVPLGIWLVLKLIPAEVLEASREQAKNTINMKLPKNLLAGTFILIIWAIALVIVIHFFNLNFNK